MKKTLTELTTQKDSTYDVRSNLNISSKMPNASTVTVRVKLKRIYFVVRPSKPTNNSKIEANKYEINGTIL